MDFIRVPLRQVLVSVTKYCISIWQKTLPMGETHWDPDEYVELEYYTLSELLEAIKAEQIKDSKSLAALMLAMPYLK